MILEAIMSNYYLIGRRLAIDAGRVNLYYHIFTSGVHLGLGDIQEGVGVMWLGKIGVRQDRVFLVTLIKIDRVVHLVISSSEPFRKGPCIQSGLHNLLVLPIHVIPLATGVFKRLKFEGLNGQLRWGILLLTQVVEVSPLH